MEYTICKLSELNEEQLHQAATICVEGLYNAFSLISKDKNILVGIFKDSFDKDMNYACLHESKAVGFIGVANSSKRAAGAMKPEIFERFFEKNKAKMMAKPIVTAFTKPKLQSEKEMEIEFLAVSPDYQGKGIGTLLIQYVFESLPYVTCQIEVFSKNPGAKRLYERLGFEQVSIRTDLWLWLRGIGKVITLRQDIRK